MCLERGKHGSEGRGNLQGFPLTRQELRDAYRKCGISRSFYDQKLTLPEIKEARPEYKGVRAHVLQGTLETLDKAFKAFFRRVQLGSKAGYSSFNSRLIYGAVAVGMPEAVRDFSNFRILLVSIGNGSSGFVIRKYT